MSGSGDPKNIQRNSLSLAAKIIGAIACILIIFTGNVATTGGSEEGFYADNERLLSEDSILSVPYYNQGDTNWCLYYCLAMMYNYNNCAVEAWEIAEYFNSGHNETFTQQYNPYDNSLEQHAENAYSLKLRKTIWGYNLGEFDTDSFNNVIKSNIDRGQPVLMAFQYENSNGIKEGHAILAIGYDEEHIYLTDSSGAITAGLFRYTEGYIAVPVSWEDFNEELVSRTSPTNMAFTIEVLGDAPGSSQEGSIYVTDHSNSDYSCLSFTNRSNQNDIALLRFDGTCDKGYTVVSKEDITSERQPSTQDMMSVYFTVSNPTSSEKDYEVTSNFINTKTGEVMESFNFDIEVSLDPFETVSKGINYSNQLQFVDSGNYAIVLTLLDKDDNVVDSTCIDFCIA